MSFETAILPHLDAAYNLARWLMRGSPDGRMGAAEDVVQDAMARALTHFGQFRGQNPRAWILQIVRNCAYSALRGGHGKFVPLAEMEDDGMLPAALHDPGDTPEQALVRARQRLTVEQMLDKLPTELREALVLREMEELSYKEIAQVTDMPIGTVMSRLWRARQMMAALLPKDEMPRDMVTSP